MTLFDTLSDEIVCQTFKVHPGTSVVSHQSVACQAAIPCLIVPCMKAELKHRRLYIVPLVEFLLQNMCINLSPQGVLKILFGEVNISILPQTNILLQRLGFSERTHYINNFSPLNIDTENFNPSQEIRIHCGNSLRMYDNSPKHPFALRNIPKKKNINIRPIIENLIPDGV